MVIGVQTDKPVPVARIHGIYRIRDGVGKSAGSRPCSLGAECVQSGQGHDTSSRGVYLSGAPAIAGPDSTAKPFCWDYRFMRGCCTIRGRIPG